MTVQTHADTQMPLRIAHVHDAADGIRSFELVQPDGTELPPFTPGSHVRVQAPNGLMRKYSLCNDPAERDRYQVAVKREVAGRVRTKYAAKLKFLADESFDESSHIDQLLRAPKVAQDLDRE